MTDDQANRIEEKLDKLLTLMSGVSLNAAPLQAYDLPPLTEAEAIADEKTVNKDGSIWIMNPAFGPGNADGSQKRVKMRVAYGYISPKKCPELFDQARRALGPEQFQAFLTEWENHKYGIYTDNAVDATLDGNALWFMARVHRIRDQQPTV